MDKISINLIPKEEAHAKKPKASHSIFFILSLLLLGVVLSASGVFLYLHFHENDLIGQANNQVSSAQTRLSSFSKQQTQLSSLKGRLDAANSLLSQDSLQSRSFNLIDSLVPSNVVLTQFTADTRGNVSVLASSTSLDSMETFLNSLVDSKQNQGYITSSILNSFQLDAMGKYTADLSLNMK